MCVMGVRETQLGYFRWYLFRSEGNHIRCGINSIRTVKNTAPNSEITNKVKAQPLARVSMHPTKPIQLKPKAAAQK